MIQKINSFEYVIAVAEKNSVSDAAEMLNIAQSALSRHIAEIEKKTGIELFDRRTLPLTLTEAGRCFVSAGRTIIDAERQLTKQIEDIKQGLGYEIRVGIGPTRAQTLNPIILNEFIKSFPGVRVVSDEDRTAQLCDKLKEGKIDLMISFADNGTETFETKELYEERVDLAVPERYYAEAEAAMINGKVDLRKINAPFVSLHNGQRLRNALEIMTRRKARILYDCDYLESAMALVRDGIGVTLAPYTENAGIHSDKIRFYPFSIPDDLTADELWELMSIIQRKIGIFYRKEQFLSEAEKGYIAAAKTVCEKL